MYQVPELFNWFTKKNFFCLRMPNLKLDESIKLSFNAYLQTNNH